MQAYGSYGDGDSWHDLDAKERAEQQEKNRKVKWETDHMDSI